MSNRDDFDVGTEALQKWYNDECRSCAQEILREAKERNEDEEDVLRETIDTHEYIIYTFKAQLVIALSSNADAYEDEMGEKAPTDEARAFMAMCADVREYFDTYRNEEEENEDEAQA